MAATRHVGFHRATAAAWIALALPSGTCVAQEAPFPVFSFSGFGTLGVAHSNLRDAEFSSTPFKPRGTGDDQPWSAGVDSILALQATATLAPRLSGLLQVVAEQNYDRTFRPHVEWASLRYQFGPDASVRAGRIVLQTLLATDTRKVGYTHAWVRPPVEVYSLVPVTHSDGIDASYRTALGPVVASSTLTLGRSRLHFPSPDDSARADADARRIATLSVVLEYGNATLRVNQGRARITLPSTNALFDSYRRFGPAGAAIADRYELRDVPVSFHGIGAGYDPGAWFVAAEWSRFRANDLLGPKSAWYAGGGYRIGPFTPYATYARARARSFSDPGLDLAGMPPAPAQAALALDATLDTLLRRKVAQQTIAIGVRWDVAKDAALKLQYDRTRVGAGSNGAVVNLQPGYRTGGRFGVLSVNLDFVF